MAAVAAGFADAGGTGAVVALVGAGAGEFAATAEDDGDGAAVAGAAAGEVAAFAAGAFAAGEVTGAAAGEVAAFAAGEVPGAADGAGLVLDGGGAFWSSDGARFPMFDKSGPTRIFPSNAGRSKM